MDLHCTCFLVKQKAGVYDSYNPVDFQRASWTCVLPTCFALGNTEAQRGYLT